MSGADRAVSDTIGYVLIFSLIAATVGLAFVGGLASLESVRDVERVDNAERAFDVLAENVDDVRTGEAPSRATEIKLADASLGLADPVTVNVSGVDTSDPGRSFSTEYTTRPIVFAAADSEVVYSMGAVFRGEPGGTALLRSPSLITTRERVVVPVLVTRADGRTNVGGSTTVLVRTERAVERTVVAEPDEPYDTLYLNLTSPRADAWARYLDGHGDLSCSVVTLPGDDRVECSVTNPQRVVVTVVSVDVALE